MVYKCVVVVRSDDGTVQRSLALHEAPTSLEALTEHLKTLDLRLQSMPFTLCAASGAGGEEPVELLSDDDAARLWTLDGGVVNLDIRIHGTADPHSIFSSTYFGSDVVSLIIFPPLQDGLNADADVIEKQLVIPLTGALTSLKRAIYCSLPTTAGLRASTLTVFGVTEGTTRELVPLTSDIAADELLHRHAKRGTPLAVTYSLPTKPQPSPPKAAAAAPTVVPHSPPAADSEAPQSPHVPALSSSASAPPSPASPPKPALSLGGSDTSPTTSAKTHSPPKAAAVTTMPVTLASPTPTPPTARTLLSINGVANKASLPPSAAANPEARGRCAQVRFAVDRSRLPDAQTTDFWFTKGQDGLLKRLIEHCEALVPADMIDATGTSLSVLSGGHTSPLKDDAELREWLVMTGESGAVLTVVLSAVQPAVLPATPPLTTAVPQAPPEKLATQDCDDSGRVEVAVPPLSPTPLSPRPPSCPRAAAATAAPPPPRRLSSLTPAAAPTTPSSSRVVSSSADVSAEGSPSKSPKTGSSTSPSVEHSEPAVAGPLKSSLSVHDDTAVAVFMGAPPPTLDHTGLEALVQLFVRWGGCEALVQCTLRPGLMLEDLKAAIADEFGGQLRASSSFQLFVCERSHAPETGELLDTEAKLRSLVESASAELTVLEVRRSSRASGPAKEALPLAKALTLKLAERLIHQLASDSQMSALQRLLEPCEARLEATDASAREFFSTLRALSPNLALPRTVCGLRDFVEHLLEGVSVDESIKALRECLTQCHCVIITQPLSLLRNHFFAEAHFTDVSVPSTGETSPSPLRVARSVVELFCGDRQTGGLAQTDVQEERTLAPDFLVDLYAGNVERMNGLCKARAAGALHLPSLLTEPHTERHSVIVEHLRRELKHSFDSCSATKLENFIQQPDVAATAAHDALLSIAGGLLAPNPVANGTLWLQEHFKNKMADVLYTKMRTFDRSDAVALPHLIKCCWTILDPSLDPSQLLVGSPCASHLGRWALLALQLECLHRGLVFPPPPMYGTVRQGPRPVSFSTLAFRADSTLSLSVPSTAAATHQPSRERSKGKKVQYQYKFNWNELGSPRAFSQPTMKKKK